MSYSKVLFSLLLVSIIFVFTISTIVLAQPGLPGDPAQSPIDGGLGLLAAAGGAYAIKKLRDKKKSEL